VDTVHNTLLDALRAGEAAVGSSAVAIPEGPFAVVSLHRFENIFSHSRLAQIVELLMKISKGTPLLFILHKPTEKKLEQFGLRETLEQCPRIELRPRYSYFEFIRLIKSATFVVTDGGSNQEECYYMGKPCLIMRNTSERQEGIGSNAVISEYDFEKIRPVMENPAKFAIVPEGLDVSPSKIIVDELIQLAPGHNR
jgi:UDP-N-acetylglucosamine 2-epimerase (non-hydrolysing)